MNNTGVTGRILPLNTDFEHARVWARGVGSIWKVERPLNHTPPHPATPMCFLWQLLDACCTNFTVASFQFEKTFDINVSSALLEKVSFFCCLAWEQCKHSATSLLSIIIMKPRPPIKPWSLKTSLYNDFLAKASFREIKWFRLMGYTGKLHSKTPPNHSHKLNSGTLAS